MRYLLVLFFALGLGACALTTEHIDVPYESAGPAPAVSGAGHVKVEVAAMDGRTVYRDRVSSKKNGFGMEMAPILASNDIVATIGEAIESELTRRGFVIGQGGVRISLKVTRFYNDFGMGVISGDAAAEVSFDLDVLGADGATRYSRRYSASRARAASCSFSERTPALS